MSNLRQRTLSTGEVAALCGVSDKLVQRWVDTGALIGHRLPLSAVRRVYPDDLVRFMRRHGMRVPPKLVARAGR